MNNIKKFSIISGVIASISATAIQAVPLCYTFEGVVASSHSDNNAVPSLSLGDPVSYVFLVDDQVTGSTNGGVYEEYGIREESTEGSDNYSYEFYTELVSATGLIFGEDSPDGHGHGSFDGAASYSNDPTHIFYNNPGNAYSYFGGRGTNGSFWIELNLDVPRTNIESYAGISQWMSENDISSGMNSFVQRDDEGNSSRYQSYLYLTSISATPSVSSVPEPSTYLLMGLGLMGIGARRLKQLLP